MARRRMVVWRGISQLDGVTPLVVLATYDSNPNSKSSENIKTGNMIQIWILRDDIDPSAALKLGLDGAICGTCPHMSIAAGGSGACYVQVWQGPLSTWRAYKRGKTKNWAFDLEAFRGRKVRFGAYGDPAAVPWELLNSIAEVARAGGGAVTGYTHAWRTADPRFAEFCMASADSIAEGIEARKVGGYRNFIVREPGAPKPKGAVECPASIEAGKKTVCADCLQCGGTSNGRKADITIMAHGGSKSRFRPLELAVV